MILIKEYNLTKYYVEVFKKDESTTFPDEALLDDLYQTLENKEYPSEIVDILQNLHSVKRIIIYDHDNNILVHSTNGIDTE